MKKGIMILALAIMFLLSINLYAFETCTLRTTGIHDFSIMKYSDNTHLTTELRTYGFEFTGDNYVYDYALYDVSEIKFIASWRTPAPNKVTLVIEDCNKNEQEYTLLALDAQGNILDSQTVKEPEKGYVYITVSSCRKIASIQLSEAPEGANILVKMEVSY